MIIRVGAEWTVLTDKSQEPVEIFVILFERTEVVLLEESSELGSLGIVQ